MDELQDIPVEELQEGDIIGGTPEMMVLGAPVVGPIPSFNVDEAIVVPVLIGYAESAETVIAFRPGQTVQVQR